MRRIWHAHGSAIALWLLCGLASTPTRAAAIDDLRSFCSENGLTGQDLSPWLTKAGARSAWLSRPAATGLESRSLDPAIRVHYPVSALALGRDLDADGVPDRVQAALRLATRTWIQLRASHLPLPADDGDAELDLYLQLLDGVTPGYTVIEGRAVPGRGGFGFTVADLSPKTSEDQFAAAIVRGVTRLAFAAADVEAPSWWLEPSVAWVELGIGVDQAELERAVQARWNHPERGIDVDDPLLAKGNVSYLLGVQDPLLERRFLEVAWQRLASRPYGSSAWSAIEAAAQFTLHLELADLGRRAAVAVWADGVAPTRVGATIQTVPALLVENALSVSPSGQTFIPVSPDPREPVGTRLKISSADAGWKLQLLAKRRRGGWDLCELRDDAEVGIVVPIPWSEYERAVVIASRSDGIGAVGSLHLEGSGEGAAAPLAWSAVSAQNAGDGVAVVAWSSAWERGLFAWTIEYAPAADGPWSSALSVPIPAVGREESETGYQAQILIPSGWAKTYFRVVALSPQGLRLTGPSVALRTSEP